MVGRSVQSLMLNPNVESQDKPAEWDINETHAHVLLIRTLRQVS